MWKAALLAPVGWVVAQTAPAGPELVGWVNYGVLGLLVLGLITGRVTTAGETAEAKRLLNEEQERNDALQAQLVTALERSLPVLAESSSTLEKVQELLALTVDRARTIPGRNEVDLMQRRHELQISEMRGLVDRLGSMLDEREDRP